jgi:hypothetical protein
VLEGRDWRHLRSVVPRPRYGSAPRRVEFTCEELPRSGHQTHSIRGSYQKNRGMSQGAAASRLHTTTRRRITPLFSLFSRLLPDGPPSPVNDGDRAERQRGRGPNSYIGARVGGRGGGVVVNNPRPTWRSHGISTTRARLPRRRKV